MSVSRRSVLVGSSVAMASAFAKAHGLDPPPSQPTHFYDHHDRDVQHRPIHEGKGSLGVKFFRFEKATRPAVLLIYTIPPGCSEGVHVHKPGISALGSFDEFYYIMSGSGVMQIAGEVVPVKAGDHIFTPNGVEHGIENTSAEGDLSVYLVAMIRD